MASQQLPSIDDLRQRLRYEPETGKLFWLVDCGNGVTKGQEAFASTSKSLGYKCGGVLGWRGLAHKVIWALHYGEWPNLIIDHANGDKTDNRIMNLRLATPKQNRANQGKVVGKNKKGAAFVKGFRAKPWRACIATDGKIRHLGYFRCETSAHIAYLQAARQTHGEFAKVGFS